MENKQDDLILTSIENGVQKVFFNRPTKKNALTREMYTRVIEILNESANNKEVTVLVFTGIGDFYSSGNDFISYLTDESVDSSVETVRLQKFIDLLITYPKLLIAIANGPAIGIAATTLALFDIVYASETAYFMTPFCKLGLSPEGCSSYTFPRIMGPSKAGEMLFFGEKLTANKAARVGFVSKVYKAGAIDEVWTHIGKIANLSKESMASTKRLLSQWNKNLLMEVNNQELIELRKVYASPSFAENMVKFMSRKSKM
ncbi:enoyl-CoA delta isomerase 2, mitochondrial [Nasonia vitripennis]|uniref:Enoyl-CoA delta isomerase 2, mitochondrial n=1 Tax=Nasonia vitripennis TaxID=7425 RepID=A0A7M7GCD0_NASVI|nr:enoyl-CoA delta isomerase 2, mitochondrial [Nasonia vitripennis]